LGRSSISNLAVTRWLWRRPFGCSPSKRTRASTWFLTTSGDSADSLPVAAESSLKNSVSDGSLLLTMAAVRRTAAKICVYHSAIMRSFASGSARIVEVSCATWFRRQTPTVAMMTVISSVKAKPAARRVPILSLMKLPMIYLVEFGFFCRIGGILAAFVLMTPELS